MDSPISRSTKETNETIVLQESFGVDLMSRPIIGFMGAETGFLPKSLHVIIGMRVALPKMSSQSFDDPSKPLIQGLRELNNELRPNGTSFSPLHWMITNHPHEPTFFNIYFSLEEVTDPYVQLQVFLSLARFAYAVTESYDSQTFGTETPLSFDNISLPDIRGLPFRELQPSLTEKFPQEPLDYSRPIAVSKREPNLQTMILEIKSEGYQKPPYLDITILPNPLKDAYLIYLSPKNTLHDEHGEDVRQYIYQIKKYINTLNY